MKNYNETVGIPLTLVKKKCFSTVSTIDESDSNCSCHNQYPAQKIMYLHTYYSLEKKNPQRTQL